MIYELNGKVEVAGMEVEPGELVHMDRGWRGKIQSRNAGRASGNLQS